MEHLLQPGERAPICVPNYQPRPDEDGNTQTVDDCTRLFDAAVKQKTWPALENETTALWIEHCRRGRVYNLCHALLDQFYFGVIYQILGPEVVMADFTVRHDDGLVFLSTTKLEEYLMAWKARVDQLDEDERAQCSDRVYSMLYQSMSVLRSLTRFLDWSYERVPVKQAYPDDEEPLGNTHFACAVLHQAFVRCRTRIFHIDEGSNYGLGSRAPWLEKRLEREGWCPYTSSMLFAHNAIDDIAYAYHVATTRTETADHGRCSEAACLANDVAPLEHDIEEHERRHVGLRHVNTGCDCWIIETPLADIKAILGKGETPILRIGTDDGYKLSLHAREAEPGTQLGSYVALSHVWVDGLGSPFSNTITQCQLTRIADRLGQLEATDACGALCIWIDTLCIPVGSRSSRLRNLAIQNMHQVYKDAYAVIVMDADLLLMQRQPRLEELGMRMYLSAWASRLWTYQESALNDRLLIMTADSLLDVESYCKLWYDENPVYTTLQHNLVENAFGHIIRLRGPYMLSRYSSRPLRTPTVDHDNTLSFERVAQMLLTAITSRTSSRADDEAIVVAAYLNLPLKSILMRSGDDMMVALLEMMPFIPSSLLFSSGERLRAPGFRWAPRSFTRAKGGNVEYIEDRVQLSADDSHEVWPVAKLHGRFGGLWAFCAAIKLEKVFSYVQEGKRERLLMVFELSGTVHWFALAFGLLNPRHQEEEATLRQLTQQMLQTKKHLMILLTGTIRNLRGTSSAVLVEETGEANDPEHEGALQGKYILPGVVQQANDGGPRVQEAIKEAMGTNENNTQGYLAEYVEPRYWLVD